MIMEKSLYSKLAMLHQPFQLPSRNAPFADFQQPKFEEFNFNDDIKKPDFDFPNFKPFDMNGIKSYVPENNEKFTGSVYSYNSYSSDVNGVKNSGATLTTLNNNNGKVEEKKIDFHNGPH